MSVDAKSFDVKTPLNRPSSRNRERLAPTSDINELHARLREDPRFNPPAPSPWKRAALLLVIVLLCWLAFRMRKALVVEQEVVHARRYSQEYKFRPAASPIVTETLANGKVRVRGAVPTMHAH
ncbi:hypothetical protein EIP86_000719 [Pleurotus ostreatoroseus]|nr:hypothetical protein EIP86_000719 [Pleurotus ostreatoroseus]